MSDAAETYTRCTCAVFAPTTLFDPSRRCARCRGSLPSVAAPVPAVPRPSNETAGASLRDAELPEAIEKALLHYGMRCIEYGWDSGRLPPEVDGNPVSQTRKDGAADNLRALIREQLRGQQRPAAPAAPPGVAAYAEMLAAAVGEPSEPVTDDEVEAACEIYAVNMGLLADRGETMTRESRRLIMRNILECHEASRRAVPTRSGRVSSSEAK